jgi:hypothetical protein
MKLFRVLLASVILLFIVFGIDYFSLSDNWRFYGWEMLDKKEKGVVTKQLFSTSPVPSGNGLFPESN